MKLPQKLNNIIDFLGIIIPLIVDLVMNVISFSILAPDFISRIAFVALAIMIVIFVPRSWSKRQFISYAIFVSVVVFADWSFTLATTTESAENTASAVIAQDVELERLRSMLEKTELKIEDLHRQYSEAAKRETLQELNAQIEFEQNRLEKIETEYNTRLHKTEAKAAKTKLTAEDIFNAIPSAIKHKRIIPLIVWLLVFLGVQLVVATSIDIKETSAPVRSAPGRRQPHPRPAVTPTRSPRLMLIDDVTLEDIKKWVHASYYHITNQGSNLILSPENFFKLLPNFDLHKYDNIRSVAVQNGVIDKYGHALIIDEAEAARKIKEA